MVFCHAHGEIFSFSNNYDNSLSFCICLRNTQIYFSFQFELFSCLFSPLFSGLYLVFFFDNYYHVHFPLLRYLAQGALVPIFCFSSLFNFLGRYFFCGDRNLSRLILNVYTFICFKSASVKFLFQVSDKTFLFVAFLGYA